MPGPKTLDEQIGRLYNELADDEICQPAPVVTLLIIAKLREPALYKRIRSVIFGK